MNIPHLNLSRLPPNSGGAATGGAPPITNTTNAPTSNTTPPSGYKGRAITNTEPSFTCRRPGAGAGTSTGITPRPPASSADTPLTSPRQAAVYHSASAAPATATSPTGVYGSPSLARRAAELAGVLDFDVMRCTDCFFLQRKVVETAERLVRAERWYEEQLRDRSSYFHHRLAHLSKYISDVEMTNAPRNINVSSAASRSASLYARGSGGGGSGAGGSESLMGSLTRSRSTGMTTIASRHPPYHSSSSTAAAYDGAAAAEPRLTSATAAPAGNSNSNAGRSPGASATSGLTAAERTANSKTFTAMIQSILNRDRGDLQGERERRRRASGSGTSSPQGGTPLKMAAATPDSGRGPAEEAGSSARTGKRRTASKPTLHRRSLGVAANSSGTTTPTRNRYLQSHPQPRRGSLGSLLSAFSNNSGKSPSRASSQKARKGSAPRKAGSSVGRSSARRRRQGSPLSTAAKEISGNSESGPLSSSQGSQHRATAAAVPGGGSDRGHPTNDFYASPKYRVGPSGYTTGGSEGATDGSSRLTDGRGGEVLRGSDMRPQPPSSAVSGRADTTGTTTPLRKR